MRSAHIIHFILYQQVTETRFDKLLTIHLNISYIFSYIKLLITQIVIYK